MTSRRTAPKEPRPPPTPPPLPRKPGRVLLALTAAVEKSTAPSKFVTYCCRRNYMFADQHDETCSTRSDTQKRLNAMGDPHHLLPHTRAEWQLAGYPKIKAAPEHKRKSKGTRRSRKRKTKR